jgi:hypothetical protein
LTAMNDSVCRSLIKWQGRVTLCAAGPFFLLSGKGEESAKLLLACRPSRRILIFGASMANQRVNSISRAEAQAKRKRPTRRLQTALKTAWAPETSFDPAGWSSSNPAWGQCAVTALIVQDHCGGSIVSGEVNGIPHFWNRLPTDEDLDLTLGQFGKAARHSRAQLCDRDFVLSYPETVRRYRQLQDRVSSNLTTRIR